MRKLSSVSSSIEQIVREEEIFWSEQFQNEMKANRKELFSTVWWQEYYHSIASHFQGYVPISSGSRVLEPGCGSGKASIMLGRTVERTLLDISENALEFARLTAHKFQASHITYVKGDIFAMPFEDAGYDLVWNIGVVEHYDIPQMQKIFEEMIRTTRSGGVCAIGVPNSLSGPILKARMLNWRMFKNIAGYRLGSEKFYNSHIMTETLLAALEKSGRQSGPINITRYGNPLPMETPAWILGTLGRVLYHLLPHCRFLTFYSIRIL